VKEEGGKFYLGKKCTYTHESCECVLQTFITDVVCILVERYLYSVDDFFIGDNNYVSIKT